MTHPKEYQAAVKISVRLGVGSSKPTEVKMAQKRSRSEASINKDWLWH